MSTVRRSLAFSLADNYLGVALQLVSTFIISRILSPGEIGIFAVAAALSAFAGTFRDFGVAEYLIQAPQADERRIRAALAANISVSWLMAVVLLAVSVPAAAFYRSEGVASVLQVMSVNFLLIPFGAVTMACFRRELDYRPIFIINTTSSLVAFVVAVTAASGGLGYMSMAWASLAGIVATVTVAAVLRPTHMPWIPSLRGIGEVIRFGKFAGSVYLMEQLGRSAPEAVIGRVLDMTAVAFFSRANGVLEIFNRAVLRAVTQVCLPYFAREGRIHGDAGANYLKTVALVTAVGWPFFLVAMPLAYPLIRILYGPQWLPSVALAQILCIVAIVELPFYLSSEMLVAKGRIDLSTRLQLLSQGIKIAGIIVFVPFGLPAVCWALVAAGAANAALSSWYLWRTIGLRPALLLRSLASSAFVTLCTAAPGLLIYIMRPVTEETYLGNFMLAAPLSLGVWLASIALTRHPIWAEVRRLADFAGALRRKHGPQ